MPIVALFNEHAPETIGTLAIMAAPYQVLRVCLALLGLITSLHNYLAGPLTVFKVKCSFKKNTTICRPTTPAV